MESQKKDNFLRFFLYMWKIFTNFDDTSHYVGPSS